MRGWREKIERILRLDRAVRLVWQSSPRWALANILLVVLRGFLPLCALYLLKEIIDAVEGAIGTADRRAAFTGVIFWIVLAGGVSLLDALSRSLARLVSEAQTLCVLDHVHHLLHCKSVSVDLAYYDDPRYYDTLHRAQLEAPYRPTSIVNGLLSLA
ncbi:MAG: ABC transporter ATP-binding protein, partial [Deltaproteobacteria bacterium]